MVISIIPFLAFYIQYYLVRLNISVFKNVFIILHFVCHFSRKHKLGVTNSLKQARLTSYLENCVSESLLL